MKRIGRPLRATLLLALIGAFALSACSDDDSGEPSPAPTSEPTATAAVETPPSPPPATATPSVAESIESMTELPQTPIDGFAIYVETGCWGCGGPAGSIVRIYRDPSGAVRTETVFEPDAEQFIGSLTASADGQKLAVTTCSIECVTEGAPVTPRTLHLSGDGGITWEVAATFEDGSGLLRDELYRDQLVMARINEAFSADFFLYPSGEELNSPNNGDFLAEIGPPAIWTTSAGDAFFDAEGNPFPSSSPDSAHPVSALAGDEGVVMSWLMERPGSVSRWLVTLHDAEGATKHTFGIEGRLHLAPVPHRRWDGRGDDRPRRLAPEQPGAHRRRSRHLFPNRVAVRRSGIAWRARPATRHPSRPARAHRQRRLLPPGACRSFRHGP